jgi:hypothetical protein
MKSGSGAASKASISLAPLQRPPRSPEVDGIRAHLGVDHNIRLACDYGRSRSSVDHEGNQLGAVEWCLTIGPFRHRSLLRKPYSVPIRAKR